MFQNNVKSRAIIHGLISAITLIGATLISAQNLVPNGGFESGTTGWSNSTGSGASASFSLEKAQPYAGANSLKIVVNTLGPNPWNVQTLGLTFTDLGSGRATSISFRARAASAGTRVRFVMQSSVYKFQDFALSTAWTYFVWNHTTAEVSPRLRIQYPDVGTVWLDEISVIAHNNPGSATLVTLDPTDRHQTMDGIGGALTWYSSRVVSSPNKNTLEGLIFDDLGLDIIRLKNWYFPTGYPSEKSPTAIPSNTGARANFNASKTFYDWAKKPGRDIKVLFSSWSPPASLKSTGDIQNGGTLAKDANGKYRYADLAQYWVDLYDNLGWTPDYLSFQNEPGYVATWESCQFAPTETTTQASYPKALEVIYNALKNRADVPVFIGPESENMNAFLTQAVPLRSVPYVGIYAFHNYNIGDASRIDPEISKLNNIRDDFNDRPNWMSEFSKDNLDWFDTAKVIHNTLVEANSSAYIYWQLVWDSATLTSVMIDIDASGNYVIGPSYHAVKHYSKHISRGYQRFEVTEGSTAIRVSGYLDPTGKKLTLIALNAATSSSVISLRLGALPVTNVTAFQTSQAGIASSPFNALGTLNHTQNQTLPAESITTYVIDLEKTLNPYDPGLLRVDSIEHEGNQVSLTMPSQPGHDFVLWKSNTLAEGSWQMVTDAVFTESGGQLILTDPTPDTTRAFYRVQRHTGL